MTRYRSSQGFTLIEIMVAVLLLVIVMAAFVPVFLSGLNHASTARYRSLANNIARERMEQVRQLDYREIQEDTANPGDARNLSQRFEVTQTVRGITFTVNYTVSNSTSAGAQLKKVLVTVGWSAPPVESPAVVQTLIHQQFLGPRGSSLAVSPTPTPDPEGSPFPLLSDQRNTAYYRVAEADWPLVCDNVSGTLVPRNVYLRLAFVNDAGQALPLGDADNEYRIGNTALRYDVSGGHLNDVWFEYPFEPTAIPDGYWELQAVMYNEYDQPGNVWRLRVRLENQPPAAPVVTAVATDDHTIALTWIPGPEGDRESYELERTKWDATSMSWPGIWTSVTTLLPNASNFDDVGWVSSEDPWGTDTSLNNYIYRLTVVDLADNRTLVETSPVQLPPPTTTTTDGTTTTTLADTTTTTVLYNTQIQNNSSHAYSITIKDALNATVFTGTAAKTSVLSVTPLPAGSYHVTADYSGSTLPGDFSLPALANQVVFLINK